VKVEGEKESLTSLGREELQDDRVAWMAVLSRQSSECEDDKLPTELRNEVAVAETLLEPNAISEKAATPKTEDQEEGPATADGVENEKSRSMARPNLSLTILRPDENTFRFLASTTVSGNTQECVANDRVREWNVAWIPERVSQSAFTVCLWFRIDVTFTRGRAIRERRINSGRS